MKIYWKVLIWNCIILPWLKLIYRRKSAYWKEVHGIYWHLWNSEQFIRCEKAMASFLSKLDDMIRRITTEDNAITTVISTNMDQKVHKSGKVIAMKRITN